MASFLKNLLTGSPKGDAQYLVTDATGYLGSHCVQALLAGGQKVVGVVPVGVAAEEECFLRTLDGSEKLTLVDAPEEAAAWREVVRGCGVVLLVGLPGAEDAVEATEAVIQACLAEKVKRVVLTSAPDSVDPLWDATPAIDDDSTWTHADGLGEECPKSVGPVERAAWRLVENTPLELSTVLPACLVGPLLSPDSTVDEHAPVRMLLQGECWALPPTTWALVDVRDVAKLQVLVASDKSAAGKRFWACGAPGVPTAEIARLLAGEYNSQGFAVPQRSLPTWALHCAALIDPKVQAMVQNMDKEQPEDREANGRGLLGQDWTSWEQSILDMAASMVQFGMGPGRKTRGHVWLGVAVLACAISFARR